MAIVFQNLSDHRSELDRHRENSSRLAHAQGSFRSTGIGSLEFPTRVDFGVTFMTKPMVTTGNELDVDELEDLLTEWANKSDVTQAVRDQILPDNGTPAMPLVSAYVTDWDTDRRGYYTGAWCGIRVYYPAIPVIAEGLGYQDMPDVPVVVIHHFHFSGIGMKDIPTQLTD